MTTIHDLVTQEALERGGKAALADARLGKTRAGLHELVRRAFDPARQGLMVDHSRVMRDPNNLEMTGTVTMTRRVTQGDVDELLGYQAKLTGWIDELVGKGQLSFPE